MCATCGCGEAEVRLTTVGADEHEHGSTRHDHDHAHGHDARPRTTPNRRGAAHPHPRPRGRPCSRRTTSWPTRNRAWLAERGDHRGEPDELAGRGQDHAAGADHPEPQRDRSRVIEGDQETVFDAERIRAAGARAVQVNTGAGCHLDAGMVARALEELQPERGQRPVHRERRQPGLPGPLRPRGACARSWSSR